MQSALSHSAHSERSFDRAKIFPAPWIAADPARRLIFLAGDGSSRVKLRVGYDTARGQPDTI
jgi:hypothetical protein